MKKKKLYKLNLGCGNNKLDGYINVDKYGEPDLKFDLEKFPWPWKDNSIEEIVMHHVLEHLGAKTKTYLKIIQELYRICTANALIKISVPHPRHDTFLNDPTHVRPITIESLDLFSKKNNQRWIKNKLSHTTLALYLDVDFEIINNTMILDPYWHDKYINEKIKKEEMMQIAKQYNNVIIENNITLIVIKQNG